MESKFDGTVLGLLGINLMVWFLTTITFGIAYPWALVAKRRYITEHSIVGGRRLSFDGTGGQLFGTWLKVFFLTLIPLGVYWFWAELVLTKWVVYHTHFDGDSAAYAPLPAAA